MTSENLIQNRITLSACILQTLLAVVVWLFYFFMLSMRGFANIDDRPVVPFVSWFASTSLWFAIPLIWSTAAPVLLWRRSYWGWCLSLAGNGLLFLVDCVSFLSKIAFRHGLSNMTGALISADTAAHLTIFAITVVAVRLQLSTKVRETIGGTEVKGST